MIVPEHPAENRKAVEISLKFSVKRWESKKLGCQYSDRLVPEICKQVLSLKIKTQNQKSQNNTLIIGESVPVR